MPQQKEGEGSPSLMSQGEAMKGLPLPADEKVFLPVSVKDLLASQMARMAPWSSEIPGCWDTGGHSLG